MAERIVADFDPARSKWQDLQQAFRNGFQVLIHFRPE
jgi:hypothetical protein